MPFTVPAGLAASCRWQERRTRWLEQLPGAVAGLERRWSLRLGAFDEEGTCAPYLESPNVLLATDLHACNVLRARRAPWLVIDPKPFVGDPAYDATQHLFNCERMSTAPLEVIYRLADLLEIDRDRVRLWAFARAAAEPGFSRDAERVRLARALA